MSEVTRDVVGEHVAELGRAIAPRIGEIVDAVAERVRAAVPVYRSLTTVRDEELAASGRKFIRFVLESLGTAHPSAPDSRADGRLAAEAGIPLPAVLAAYRTAGECVWEHVARHAAALGLPGGAALSAGATLWTALHVCVQEAASGHCDETAVRVRDGEQRRGALFEALLADRFTDGELADVAEELRLPARGEYVVIAAFTPGIGRHALLRAEEALQAAGAASVWRLLPDREIGVACLSISDIRQRELAEVLANVCTGPVVMSRPYRDLLSTGAELRAVMAAGPE
ncbi:hypothetical protein JOF53_007423 [Crossiella equi]|uniref:CdaR GGDEF-like domain-containing protein n=1 Tax=Crossiella equi TaxID=130796 RepID=A0ABS5AQ43_9PSEU|nr:hypothetical protein [Crossiella equi]MBP2478551.1 hypothetical protein [Crossiella equi]